MNSRLRSTCTHSSPVRHGSLLWLFAVMIAVCAAAIALPSPAASALGATIRGRITSLDSGAVIQGATVEVLHEAVTVVASTITNAQGRYSVTVANGTYDVRARGAALGYFGSVAVDLTVASSGSPPAVYVQNFELATFATMQSANGLDPATRVDTDGDLIPDVVEIANGLNPEQADTNADGVADGVAEIVGASALSGIVNSGDSPTMVHIAPAGPIPLSSSGGNAPIGLEFSKVRSATVYRIEIAPALGGPSVLTEDLVFGENEFVLREHVFARVTPPTGMAGGNYVVSIRGYYGDTATPVGVQSSETVAFATPTSPGPLVYSTNATLSGVVFGSDIVVAPGVELTVPAGTTLSLVSSGPYGILLGAGSKLIGEVGVVGGSIELLAASTVLIRGAIEAGNGADGANAEAWGADPAIQAVAVATAAEQGGGVRVVSNGAVTITRAGSVRSGVGGQCGTAAALGAAATTSGVRGGGAVAVAGSGGRAGDFAVLSANTLMAFRPSLLHSARGGAGGSAMATGGDGGNGAPGGHASAEAGVGGASGDIWLSNWFCLGDRYCDLGATTWAITGGEAGLVGEVFAELGLTDTTTTSGCGCSGHPHAEDDLKPKAKDGESGFLRGGDGAYTIALGDDARACGNGGDASCEGGDGGNLSTIGASYEGWGIEVSLPSGGGNGGDAYASGGSGGVEGEGRGGNGTATGGRGGDGNGALVGTWSMGGSGGMASAFGGSGCKGKDCCAPPAAGITGGGGGSAAAGAGRGGDANWFGGDGGDAIATAGSGKNGGNGCPPGSGGTKGIPNSEEGVGGDGGGFGLGDGDDGTKIETAGSDGVTGNDCCESGS